MRSPATVYRGVFSLCYVALLASALPAVALTAVQLNAINVDQRVLGHDAIAGVGDWLLSNGVLCAAVSGAEHESGLSQDGGWLVDLGYCDRDDDQLSYTHLLPQMDQQRLLPVVAIRADEAADQAAIVVERSDGQLHTLTRYAMDRVTPQRLSINTQIRRIAPGDDLSLVGQLWLHPQRALTPFSVDTRRVIRAPGFSYPRFDRDNAIEALQAMHYSDLTVLVGVPGEQPGISYAIHSEPSYLLDASGQRHRVEQFTLVEEDYTNQIWLVRPLWFGGGDNPGRLEMLQSLFMDLDEGETLYLKQSVYVGDQADVASATNQLYRGHWLHGSLDTASGRVAVFDAEGKPLTETLVDEQGRFSIRLPQGVGRCQIAVTTPWNAERRMDVVLAGKDHYLPPWIGGAPGQLLLSSPSPMQLVLKGLEGTPDPVLGPLLPSYRVGEREVTGSGQSNTLALTGLPFDPKAVALAPGRYRVYASRGVEYAVTSQDIDIVAGAVTELNLAPLVRQVDAAGWVSADFHVHSAHSFDSSLVPAQRLAAFIAQGADLLVASEHDYVADLGMLADELGMGSMLTVVSGVEVTGMAHSKSAPGTIGHINLYPWPRDEQAFAGGVPLHEGKRLRQLMAEVRARSEPPLVQLNHPRDSGEGSIDLAFFEHLSVGERYDQRLPLNNVQNRSLIEVDASSGLRDLDFDTYEIANGDQFELYQLARADWFSLILQGEFRPALANSDSHDLSHPVAMPRSYVAYDDDLRHPLDVTALLRAVKAGKVFGTTGPIPEVVLRAADGGSAQIGDVLSGHDFTLHISAQAASWVDIDQVWVYVNGVVLDGRAYRAGKQLQIPLSVAQDSFIFVEFFGQPGEIYRAVAPGHRPMAYINPIWIDADSDGKWSAPGLTKLPMAISEPHSLPGPLKR